jgi:hypothetical protein
MSVSVRAKRSSDAHWARCLPVEGTKADRRALILRGLFSHDLPTGARDDACFVILNVVKDLSFPRQDSLSAAQNDMLRIST